MRLTGRLMAVDGDRLQFSGGLENVCKLADLKMQRLLSRIDAWIDATGSDAPAGGEFTPTKIDQPLLDLDLSRGEIKTIIWACGFKPDYSWLSVPVLDRKGRLLHTGGVTPAPGLYAMGLPFMRRRNSSFIYGVADDAREISAELAGYIRQLSRSVDRAVA